MPRLLAPLASLYGLGVQARAWLYASGRLARHTLPAPVVSVGNLVVGGTGKTPIVAGLARALRDHGLRVAILSRGYGRSGRGVVLVSDGSGPRVKVALAGDEPYLLARELEGVTVVVGESRAAAGELAARRSAPDVFLLDDGFQHLGLARDLDLVALDVRTDHERLRLLPAGPLREPLAALRRADAVLLTRVHRPHDEIGIRRLVRSVHPTAPILAVPSRAVALVAPGGEARPPGSIAGQRVLAVAAIGEPAQFEADLVDLGATVVSRLRWRDHHRYRPRDLGRIESVLARSGAAAVVTTLKDLVRLEPLLARDLPLLALRVEARVGEVAELVLGRIAAPGRPLGVEP